MTNRYRQTKTAALGSLREKDRRNYMLKLTDIH